MSTIYSVADLAARLGITEAQVSRDVQSWPHNGMGDKITFTPHQVREIETLVAADPADQLERLATMQAKFEAEDAATFAGPSGYLQLSRPRQDGGQAHVEVFLLHQEGTVALSLSKDGGADLLLTKAEWEELKLHGDDAWGEICD